MFLWLTVVTGLKEGWQSLTRRFRKQLHSCEVVPVCLLSLNAENEFRLNMVWEYALNIIWQTQFYSALVQPTLYETQLKLYQFYEKRSHHARNLCVIWIADLCMITAFNETHFHTANIHGRTIKFICLFYDFVTTDLYLNGSALNEGIQIAKVTCEKCTPDKPFHCYSETQWQTHCTYSPDWASLWRLTDIVTLQRTYSCSWWGVTGAGITEVTVQWASRFQFGEHALSTLRIQDCICVVSHHSNSEPG